MSIFTGSGVAIVTPFKSCDINTNQNKYIASNEVDYREFAKLLEFNIANNTDAIIVCGTTGEPSTMSHQEKIDLIKFTVETVNKKIPVIAGTGSNSTQTAIQDSINAQNLGVDALLIVTPYYNKCTQAGLIAHYNAIADSVDLPIILYNVPSRTGVNILPETVQILSKHKNIVAVKEASGDISQIAKLAALCPDIDIYSGNDDQVTSILSLGAIGVISVAANIIPKQMHDMVSSFLEGNVKKSLALQLQYLDLNNALFCEVNPIPTKAALALMGFQTQELRLPLTQLSQNNLNALKILLEKHKLI